MTALTLENVISERTFFVLCLLSLPYLCVDGGGGGGSGGGRGGGVREVKRRQWRARADARRRPQNFGGGRRASLIAQLAYKRATHTRMRVRTQRSSSLCARIAAVANLQPQKNFLVLRAAGKKMRAARHLHFWLYFRARAKTRLSAKAPLYKTL